MSKLSLKNKILLLTITPLLVATAIIMLIVNSRLEALGQAELENTRDQMFRAKQETLKSYMQMVLTTVQPVVEETAADDAAGVARVADLLRSVKYGEKGDGYVFVYDYSGTAVAMRPKPSLEGKNMAGLQDSNGVRIIADLIAEAKRGGGYVQYRWNKPSKDAEVDKLSYALAIPKYGWMIGTGFYIDDIDDAVAAAEQRVAEQLTETQLSIAGAGLILIAICATIASLVTSRVTRPLANTAVALTDISQGDGDLTRRLSVESSDEVGQVSRGFNDFADKIQRLVMELKTGVEDLSTSTGQMTRVVSETHSDVQQQRQETEQAAAAIQQMAAAAQEVSRSAAGAASAAREADVESKSGQKIVEETIIAIEGLSNEVNRASDVIAALDSDADKIGSVINVIKDIAEQTNLLALNAAIEAARAGEYGRGFAVVADEVRTLANRTQHSTEEIQNMILRLQNGAREAVGVMEASRVQGSEAVARTGQASESLSRITQAVGTISEMNTSIASAAEEQTFVAEEISKSVHQVAEIAESASRNADGLSATTEGMSSLESRLMALVKQFRV